MKFMKLGSKPDAFQADGKFIRYVSSELATDVTINVGEVKFFLHKFPLLSKSNHMHKLLLKASEENYEEIIVADFPGGPKAFEICAKFCYGMTVTLNAHNVVAARCAAEFLEMTEDVERGNLIYKIEVFLNSSIFRSWKDSIIVLQTTKSLLPWSEDLKIVGRCIDSIASKTSVDPANITWSYTYNKRLSVSDGIVEDTMKYREKMESVPKDWWIDDICELEIDLYKRVLFAIKSRGRMDGTVIGEALKAYARRWLPDSFEDLDSDDHICWYKYLVETILCLLPSDKGEGCSCSFLLKLLKVAIMIGLDDSYSENLVKSISVKLHEASVKDLLIPVRASVTTLYDVELVQCIVKHYLLHNKCGHDLHAKMSEKDGADFVSGHSNGDGDVSLLSVGKLIDGYLTEIAHDPNLTVDFFIELSQLIPRSARPIHDGLYKAIDKYLKEHLSVTKAERKRLCALMDVKKLSMDASMHAAQNERLPLRVVVQVLFFEQVRAAAGVQSVSNNPQYSSNSRSSTIEVCARTPASECKSLGKQMSQMKIKDEELKKNGILPKRNSKTSKSGTQLLPPRSRRIFDKLWVVGRQHGENRSSETSGSSQSPASMVPGDTKSSGSSLRTRQRRHSIS